MNTKKLLKEDLVETENRFPKLKFNLLSGDKIGVLEGQLDICDTTGDYWDTFTIAILIPNSYPFCVPIVIERSSIIPRQIDRHISEEGVCCLDIEHRLLYLAKKGIRLSDFIATKVYPYLANQLYFREKGCYAGEEYAHFFEGIKQFYAEDLGLSDPINALCFLQLILTNCLPGRNEKCPCGSQTKYKNCHSSSIDLLRLVGKERLKKDVEGFIALTTEQL